MDSKEFKCFPLIDEVSDIKGFHRCTHLYIYTHKVGYPKRMLHYNWEEIDPFFLRYVEDYDLVFSVVSTTDQERVLYMETLSQRSKSLILMSWE